MKLLTTVWNINMYKYKMKSYCLKCRKDTENINPKVSKTSNGRTVVLSNCAICNSQNSRFIKNQKTKGLLSNLGIRTPISKLPILGDVLFWMYTGLKDTSCSQHIKMNEIVSNTSNGRKTILSKYTICGSKKSRFIKDQEAKGILSNLGVRAPSSKVPILGDILLWMCMLNCM